MGVTGLDQSVKIFARGAYDPSSGLDFGFSFWYSKSFTISAGQMKLFALLSQLSPPPLLIHPRKVRRKISAREAGLTQL
jgi:hypothetical protein